MRYLGVSMIFALASSGHVIGQVDGFNKGKGNTDLVGSLSYEQGLAYYLAEGTASIQRYRAALSVFAAHGITKYLDLQVNVPFIASNGASGLQDGSAYLKWLPVKARAGSGTLSFGAAIGGSTPLSDYETEGLGAIGQQASSLISLGVIQFIFDEGLFVSLVAGQVASSSPTPDDIVYTLRAGHATKNHYLEVYLQGQEAFGGKDYLGVGDLAPSTFKELGVSYLKSGGKYYNPIGDRFGWVIEANYVLTGRNVDQSFMAAGSFIMHFRK